MESNGHDPDPVLLDHAEHLSPLTRANSIAAFWQALESTKSKTFSSIVHNSYCFMT